MPPALDARAVAPFAPRTPLYHAWWVFTTSSEFGADLVIFHCDLVIFASYVFEDRFLFLIFQGRFFQKNN